MHYNETMKRYLDFKPNAGYVFVEHNMSQEYSLKTFQDLLDKPNAFPERAF